MFVDFHTELHLWFLNPRPTVPKKVIVKESIAQSQMAAESILIPYITFQVHSADIGLQRFQTMPIRTINSTLFSKLSIILSFTKYRFQITMYRKNKCMY